MPTAFALLVAIAAVAIWQLSERRLDRRYDVVADVGAPDPALASDGLHLLRSRGCTDCHGDDVGGRVLLDEMPAVRFVGSNLTALGTPAEVHRRVHLALRHGLDAERRPLLMMPSASYAHLSRREVEAIAAHLTTRAPIARALPDSAFGPLGRALLAAGVIEGAIDAERIDHRTRMPARPPPAHTLAFGEHIARLCTGCHRRDFRGGPMPHGGPDTPTASNLTPHPHALGGWTEADFVRAMRTGLRPDGRALDARAMPWPAVGRSTDAELGALYRYLRSVPAIAPPAARPEPTGR